MPQSSRRQPIAHGATPEMLRYRMVAQSNFSGGEGVIGGMPPEAPRSTKVHLWSRGAVLANLKYAN